MTAGANLPPPSPGPAREPSAKQPVTLDNCASEPIHIPGLVQDHGALLAYDAGNVLRFASHNAAEVLGVPVPALGTVFSPTDLGGHPAIGQALAEGQAGLAAGETVPIALEAVLGGRSFDLIVHGSSSGSGGVLVLEFEPRDTAAEALAVFALQAHRAAGQFKRQADIQSLLAAAAKALRTLSGFDRVMAYRFRHDDSGDIVAESRAEELEPFIGRRYPASDIPAQARRLYLVNTLRLIADTRSPPVPVLSLDGAVLDMSQCTLRSVSPVHIEYLNNLGVRASMSVSLVVNGRLWGMLACHHREPLRVPYSVRMACDVLAQIVAANVQTLLAREQARRAAEAATLRSTLVERVLHADDAFSALFGMSSELALAFGADAVVCAEAGKLLVHGELPEPTARRLVQWLEQSAEGEPADRLVASHVLADWPQPLALELGKWCGVLAFAFDAVAHGWVVLLRKEQIETIDWGGRPEKEYTTGPLGPRLTPRGSFEVWRETVRDTAEPWSEAELELARQLQAELMRATGARMAELHAAKDHLLAMLGHDLRDPLQSIHMAATVLSREGGGARLGDRIQNSSRRMQHLIGHVLDVSRLQAGIGLGMEFAETDLRPLVADLIEETGVAHPGVNFALQLPRSLRAEIDAHRFSQLVSNLLSNARHHGAAGEPIIVQLSEQGGMVRLEVSNTGEAIAPETAAQLFSAFKRPQRTNPRNRSGLGLGLYIAHEIAVGHGGSIEYSHAEPYVVFSVRFPARRPPAGSPPEAG